MGECEKGFCQVAEARGVMHGCEGECAYAVPTHKAIANLIDNDSFAASFQTMGQYRTALLKFINIRVKS